jgi:hypothetical protein
VLGVGCKISDTSIEFRLKDLGCEAQRIRLSA